MIALAPGPISGVGIISRFFLRTVGEMVEDLPGDGKRGWAMVEVWLHRKLVR
jgi:hypothetical protein